MATSYQGTRNNLTQWESAETTDAFSLWQFDLKWVCDTLQCWDWIKLPWSSSKHNKGLWEPYCMELPYCCLTVLTSWTIMVIYIQCKRNVSRQQSSLVSMGRDRPGWSMHWFWLSPQHASTHAHIQLWIGFQAQENLSWAFCRVASAIHGHICLANPWRQSWLSTQGKQGDKYSVMAWHSHPNVFRDTGTCCQLLGNRSQWVDLSSPLTPSCSQLTCAFPDCSERCPDLGRKENKIQAQSISDLRSILTGSEK